MKKLLFTFLIVVTFVTILPFKLYSQTSDENWVSLQDYLKDTYKLANNTIFPGSTNDSDLRFVSKLAYKKNASEFLPLTALHLQRFNMNNGVPNIEKDEIVISNGFDITEKGKKTKKKVLPTNGEWTIFDLEGAAVVTSVTGVSDNYGFNSAILKNIYVTLDPSKDPLALTTSYLEEKQSQAQQAFEKSLYTTPEKAGFTLERTDNLDDGTIIEHYKEGIRFIKKSNGDFASFVEPKDKRDDKTLSLKKGADQDLEYDANVIGDYQITLPDGVILKGSGINDSVLFPNGDEMITKWLNTRSVEEINLNDDKKIKSVNQLYGLGYEYFNEPLEGRIEGINHKAEKDLDKMYFEYTKSDGTKKQIDLEFYYIQTVIPNTNLATLKYGYDFSDSKSPQYYKITKTGLNPDGIRELRIPNFEVISVDKGSYTEVSFKNDDYISFSGGSVKKAHLTLQDGTIIEVFPEASKYRVSHPNGNIFVGDHGSNGLNVINNFIRGYNNGNLLYGDGILTTVSGQEYQYVNSQNETLAQQERQKAGKALLQKLYNLYGKANVDKALAGNIENGMKLQMLIDMNCALTKDDQIGNYTWYKLATDITYHGDIKYRWIRVNNKTGVIDYVGTSRKTSLF
ncbi:MAG: hypothetical protein J1F67_09350 [Muribaculaceae bacterium]|nr:hypothetical protein [Muribaculaceae bacterium]